jgi:hypothetical protein
MFIMNPIELETTIGFVCIPKTGGTYLSVNSVPRGYVDDSSKSPLKVHMPASQVQSIVEKGTPLFTMIRDPYDRACSEYYFLKSKANASIEDFTWSPATKEKLKPMAVSVSNITGYKDFFEKTCVIYDNNMSVEDYLEWTIDNPTYPFYYDTLEPKDFSLVGILEDMPTTISLLKSMYGIDAGNGDFNSNPDRAVGEPYTTDFSRSDFKSRNDIEYMMYQQGLERFQELCKII